MYSIPPAPPHSVYECVHVFVCFLFALYGLAYSVKSINCEWVFRKKNLVNFYASKMNWIKTKYYYYFQRKCAQQYLNVTQNGIFIIHGNTTYHYFTISWDSHMHTRTFMRWKKYINFITSKYAWLATLNNPQWIQGCFNGLAEQFERWSAEVLQMAPQKFKFMQICVNSLQTLWLVNHSIRTFNRFFSVCLRV